MNEETERQFIANGRYALDRLLGKGGAGSVYLAYDTMLGRWVAIKRTPSSDATISREAKVMASFQHPNIVTMHDILQEGDETIFVMELVLGQTLEDLAEPLNEDTFRNLAAQCLEGLSAAHEKNVVHRDIKPSNIMLAALQDGQDGRYRVKILDFGQSRKMEEPSLQTIDHSGAVVGSIFMMSPEQLSHEALDARTDLYSLGCVFYQALTLKRPFTGSNITEVIAAHLRHHFKPLQELRPDLPKSLTDWVEKLFELDRQNRPANSHLALEALKSTTSPAKVHILTNTTKNIAVVPAPVLKPISVVEIPDAPIAETGPVLTAVPTPTVAAVYAKPVAKPAPVVAAIPAPEATSAKEAAVSGPEPVATPYPLELLPKPTTETPHFNLEPIAEAVPVVASIPTPAVAPTRIQPVPVSVSKPLSTQQNLSLPRTPQPIPAKSHSMDSTPPPTSKTSLTPKLWIAIGAAVVLLAAGGVAGFMMVGSKLPPGFEPLVKPDFLNIEMPTGSWTMSGDTIQRGEKYGPFWTKNEYGNFQMDFEVQIPKGANSGVFLRGKDSTVNKPNNNILELELIDSPAAGALIPVQNPKQPINLADGKWHRFSIVAKDKSFTVSHNGTELYTVDISKTPLKNIPPKGRIGFQGFVGAVKYRNIAIKEL